MSIARITNSQALIAALFIVKGVILKLLLIVLLSPFCAFSQGFNYPDSLIAKNGNAAACIVKQINAEEKHILFLEGDATKRISLENVSRVYARDIGIIYESNSGFSAAVDELNKKLSNRKIIELYKEMLKKSSKTTADSGKTEVDFGMGIMLSESDEISYNSFFYNVSPIILFPIDINKAFKLEPYLAFSTGKREYDDRTLKDQNVAIGLGLLGTHKKSELSILYGFRIGYIHKKAELQFSELYPDETNRNRAHAWFWEPTVGCEYFMGQHCSIGAEAGLRFLYITVKEGGIGDEYNFFLDQSENYTETKANLTFRFYF